MAQEFSSKQPQGFKNHIEKVAIVGVSPHSLKTTIGCRESGAQNRSSDEFETIKHPHVRFSLSEGRRNYSKKRLCALLFETDSDIHSL